MGVAELNRAYFTYPGVWAYAVLTVAAVSGALIVGTGTGLPAFAKAAISVLAVVLLYPFFWYGLHRWVLHSRLLYRFERTAALWKRTHYDHHRRPNDLSVLFGSLGNTLPTLAILCGGTGFLIAGLGGALWAMAAGLVMTMLYEYVHCIQHLGYLPASPRLQRMKRLHLLHHFHNETGNFGITDFAPDKLLGSFYGEGTQRPRSPTVRNLGYTAEVAKTYPWVERLSGDGTDVPRGKGASRA